MSGCNGWSASWPAWAVAGAAATASRLCSGSASCDPAIVLLDIRMPGMSGHRGRAPSRARSSDPPAIVFTTAYDEYALQAFESQAVGYLLKPVRRERLEEALKHASRLSAPQLRAARGAASSRSRRASMLPARMRDELKLIPIKDIRFFRADQKYVTVRHTGGEDLIDESLRATRRRSSRASSCARTAACSSRSRTSKRSSEPPTAVTRCGFAASRARCP